MTTSVDQSVSETKFEDQPTMGVWLNESEGKLFVCVGEEDRGNEVTPDELVSLYQTYRPCFFNAEQTLSWLKKQGVMAPRNFDCIVSQNRLTTSGVALTVEALIWYWWEDEGSIPKTDCERAWATYSLDDSPDYSTLRESGITAYANYQRRLGRITDFIDGV